MRCAKASGRHRSAGRRRSGWTARRCGLRRSGKRRRRGARLVAAAGDRMQQGDASMAQVIVVTSGKGGVGKTTTSAAIATGLALAGKKTVVIDFDVGLRNLD